MKEDGSHVPGPHPDLVPFLARERDVIGFGSEGVGTDAGQAFRFDPPFPCHSIMHGSNKFGLASLTNLDQTAAEGGDPDHRAAQDRERVGKPLPRPRAGGDKLGNHGGAVVSKGSQKLRLGAGGTLPRRGHPGRHQGAAAVRRVLRGRLPGRADLAPDGRADRRQRHPRRARRALRAQRLRGHGRRHAGRLGATTRCAARSPSSRRSAPTSPPTRWPTWPRAASPAAR